MKRLMWFSGLILLIAGCGVSSTGTGVQSSSPPTKAVTVHTNQSTYSGTDAIHVTVQNNLDVPIYTHDTASSCSVLTLQFQVNSVWQSSDSARCPMKRRAMIVKIDAGTVYSATITASYPGLAATTFPQGMYQLLLPYSTSPDAIPTADGGQLITSAPFSING